MSAGTLYVVASPLGNLNDISARARDVLMDVHVVAAEDTRRTRVLLSHLGAKPRLVSYHAHTTAERLAEILQDLRAGYDVAVVSDAGTPGISDPGANLVASARDAGIRVLTVPGPSAVVAALSVSGFGADRFTFLGFLPRKGRGRAEMIAFISKTPWTVVLYEAPNRLVRTLEDLAAHCGEERQAVVARELTKVHEEARSGTLPSLRGYYEQSPPRGEVTLVIAGAPVAEALFDEDAARRRGQALLAAGMTGRDAAQELAVELGISRNRAYKVINSL